MNYSPNRIQLMSNLANKNEKGFLNICEDSFEILKQTAFPAFPFVIQNGCLKTFSHKNAILFST